MIESELFLGKGIVKLASVYKLLLLFSYQDPFIQKLNK